jgi:UDP:flavonoid glycosyltransferase YjiC (YdhE family)
MKVLFTTQPLSGHWHPLVPFARALEDAGHEVAFATAPAFCTTVSANGFHCFPVGTDETDEEHRARRESVAALDGDFDRPAAMWTRYFAGLWADRTLPDLLAVARRWRPDVLVRDMVEIAGCVAADSLGIPHAALQVAAYRPALHTAIAPNLDRLRAAAGLPAAPPVETLHRYLLLCPVPASYQDPTNPLPPTAHHVRHVSFNASAEERLPAWVEQLPRDAPTVYATLGTVHNNETHIMRAILDGLRGEPLNLVATTGRNIEPAIFGEQPGNVHIERYIPQSLLLPHCDLVINHGGSGTVRDAINHGLPMVIVPVAADQHVNAKRCADLRVARVVPSDNRTPEAIREATHEVLHNPIYRRNAKRLRDEMDALPGPEHVVGLLERLARERAPLYSEQPTS